MKILNDGTPQSVRSESISLDVLRLDRRDVEAVVDPVVPLREPEQLGHELAIRAAAVQVVLTRAGIREARGHAAHRRGLALAHRVLGHRPVDADVHVRVHEARKREPVLPVHDLVRLLRPEVRREPRELAVLDADVEQVDRGPVRPDDADVLDDEVERTGHGRASAVARKR